MTEKSKLKLIKKAENRFFYDWNTNMIHDRQCAELINMSVYNMDAVDFLTPRYVAHKNFCPQCKRKVAIRNGMRGRLRTSSEQMRFFMDSPKKTKSIKNSTYIKVARSNTDIRQIKPELPSKDLGPCDFARTAFEALLASGYVFSDEQIKVFSTVEGSKAFIRSKKWSLFWLLKEGETRSTFDEKVRDRYWAEVYTSGHYRFMMYSQWYKDHKHGPSKEDFINWYNEL